MTNTQPDPRARRSSHRHTIPSRNRPTLPAPPLALGTARRRLSLDLPPVAPALLRPTTTRSTLEPDKSATQPPNPHHPTLSHITPRALPNLTLPPRPEPNLPLSTTPSSRTTRGPATVPRPPPPHIQTNHPPNLPPPPPHSLLPTRGHRTIDPMPAPLSAPIPNPPTSHNNSAPPIPPPPRPQNPPPRRPPPPPRPAPPPNTHCPDPPYTSTTNPYPYRLRLPSFPSSRTAAPRPT